MPFHCPGFCRRHLWLTASIARACSRPQPPGIPSTLAGHPPMMRWADWFGGVSLRCVVDCPAVSRSNRTACQVDRPKGGDNSSGGGYGCTMVLAVSLFFCLLGSARAGRAQSFDIIPVADGVYAAIRRPGVFSNGAFIVNKDLQAVKQMRSRCNASGPLSCIPVNL